MRSSNVDAPLDGRMPRAEYTIDNQLSRFFPLFLPSSLLLFLIRFFWEEGNSYSTSFKRLKYWMGNQQGLSENNRLGF